MHLYLLTCFMAKCNLVVDPCVARYLDRSRNCRNPGQVPETDPVIVDRPPAPTPGHPDGRKAPVGRIGQGRFWFRTGARSGKFRNDEGTALRLRFHRRNLSRPGKGSVRSVHQRPVPGRRKFRNFHSRLHCSSTASAKTSFSSKMGAIGIKWQYCIILSVQFFFRKLVL